MKTITISNLSKINGGTRQSCAFMAGLMVVAAWTANGPALAIGGFYMWAYC